MYEQRKEDKLAKKAQIVGAGAIESFFPPKQPNSAKKKNSPDSTFSKHDHSTATGSVMRKMSNDSSSKSTITNFSRE